MPQENIAAKFVPVNSKRIVFLSGLPRSGSTLLANVLAMHPKIKATPSSPLCNVLAAMKHQWSNDPLCLAQLDGDFDGLCRKMRSAMAAFIKAWHADIDAEVVIDKSRSWMWQLELLRHIIPDFKMIVTLRDLRDIFASVERKQAETPLLEIPDNTDSRYPNLRAASLFSETGVIGSVLTNLNASGDVAGINQHILFVRFEDFMDRPQGVVDNVVEWIGLPRQTIDFDNIVQSTQEFDSWNRMKYPHQIARKIVRPATFSESPVSPRLLNEIVHKFSWYYRAYYPDRVPLKPDNAGGFDAQPTDSEMALSLARKIEQETAVQRPPPVDTDAAKPQ